MGFDCKSNPRSGNLVCQNALSWVSVQSQKLNRRVFFVRRKIPYPREQPAFLKSSCSASSKAKGKFIKNIYIVKYSKNVML